MEEAENKPLISLQERILIKLLLVVLMIVLAVILFLAPLLSAPTLVTFAGAAGLHITEAQAVASLYTAAILVMACLHYSDSK